MQSINSPFWTDHWGNHWPVVQSRRRLKFNIPCHAAIRRHIFHRDGYGCVRCNARAIEIPSPYTGRYSLRTDTFVSPGWRDVLVLDHILTLPAGGLNVVENFQTLCETCNRKKGHREDKSDRALHGSAA